MAKGSDYFRRGLPIRVLRVDPGDGDTPAHPHDLTEIEHDHDFNELVVVTGGQAMQRLEGVDYLVQAGDVYVLQARHRHYFYDRKKLALINVMYDEAALDMSGRLGELRLMPGFNALFLLEPQYRRQHRFESRLHLGPSAMQMAQRLATTLQAEADQAPAGFQVMARLKLLELIVFLSRTYDQTTTTQEGKTLLRVGSVIGALEQHFDEPWTIDALADLAHMSKSNLIRVFQKATGLTPIQYLLGVRLQQACDLLANSDRGVTQIAAEVGFSDSNYFSRHFREKIGQTPTAYRKRLSANRL